MPTKRINSFRIFPGGWGACTFANIPGPLPCSACAAFSLFAALLRRGEYLDPRGQDASRPRTVRGRGATMTPANIELCASRPRGSIQKKTYVSKARERRASGRRGTRRNVRGPALGPRPCRPLTKWWRAVCGDGPPRGIIQAYGFANPDQTARSGQFPDAPQKS